MGAGAHRSARRHRGPRCAFRGRVSASPGAQGEGAAGKEGHFWKNHWAEADVPPGISSSRTAAVVWGPHRDDEERNTDDDEDEAWDAHAQEYLQVGSFEAAHAHVVQEELRRGERESGGSGRRGRGGGWARVNEAVRRGGGERRWYR